MYIQTNIQMKTPDFIIKNKYIIIFLGVVFIAQLLELSSDKISASTIYHYFMYLCYGIMVIFLLTGKKNDNKNLSRIERIKKSLYSHPLRSLIIDSKKAYNEISEKHLLGGGGKTRNKKIEDNNTNQLKN